VILKDHGYCIKAFTESDFDSAFKDRVFSQLKRELYPKAKESFDSIKSLKTDFQSPYSENLTKLIKTHLPNTFTEDTPPFDMLEASVNFPEILSILKKEQSEYIEKCKEEERERNEQERKRSEEAQREEQERIRRAEQEKKYREERERRDKEEERLKNEKKRVRRNRILLWTILGLVIGAINSLFIVFFSGFSILWAFFFVIGFAILGGIAGNKIDRYFNGIFFGVCIAGVIAIIIEVVGYIGIGNIITACILAIICTGIGALVGVIFGQE